MRITCVAMLLAFCVSACSPVIVTNGKRQPSGPYAFRDAPNDVVLLQPYDPIPDQATKLGTTKVSIPRLADNGNPYLQSERLAMNEAKRLNGNLIRITHRSFFGTVLEADIYSTREPPPPSPAGGKCIIHLKSRLARPREGSMYFNDSLLLTYPLTTDPVSTFTFDAGGILAFAWPGAKTCQGVLLQAGAEYDVSFNIDYRGFVHFLILPRHAGMAVPVTIPGRYEHTGPTPGGCIVHLKAHLSRVYEGGLYFNDSLLARHPMAKGPDKEYDLSFATGGILAFRNFGASDLKGILLQKGQEYYIHLKYPAVAHPYPAYKLVDKDSF